VVEELPPLPPEEEPPDETVMVEVPLLSYPSVETI
jgi:hypothetical protein